MANEEAMQNVAPQVCRDGRFHVWPLSQRIMHISCALTCCWMRMSSFLITLQVPAKKGESTRLPDPQRPGAEDMHVNDPAPR